jgi:hypothetical protein
MVRHGDGGMGMNPELDIREKPAPVNFDLVFARVEKEVLEGKSPESCRTP